jgi:hypothetical protein
MPVPKKPIKSNFNVARICSAKVIVSRRRCCGAVFVEEPFVGGFGRLFFLGDYPMTTSNKNEGCSKPGCGFPDGRACIGCGKIVEPEIFYFGRLNHCGHTLHGKKTNRRWDSTPWGNLIDGGLAPKLDVVDGNILEHHKDGWTAIAFWDRSGDSRPNSNSAFFVCCTMDAAELSSWAKKQWPEVFNRNNFPLLVVKG